MQFQTVFTFLTLAMASLAIAKPVAQNNVSPITGPIAENDEQINTGNAVETGNGINKGQITVQQAAESCGNAQLHCCNSLEQKGEEEKDEDNGLLGLIFRQGDVGVGCAPMSGPLGNLLGGQDGESNLGDACKNQPVCCRNIQQNGLVNLGCSPIDLSDLGQGLDLLKNVGLVPVDV